MEDNKNNKNSMMPPLPPASTLWANWSIYLGGFGLISGLIVSIWNLPASLYLGLLGIACAALSKKGKPFTRQAQLGLILSILSLVSGLIITFSIIFVYDMMDSNTIFGEQLRNTLQSYLDTIMSTAPAKE